jgi:hypothetical protein
MSDQCGYRGATYTVINNLVAICRDKKRQKATKSDKKRQKGQKGVVSPPSDANASAEKAGAGHSRTRLRDSGWFFLSSGKLHSAFSEDAKENRP